MPLWPVLEGCVQPGSNRMGNWTAWTLHLTLWQTGCAHLQAVQGVVQRAELLLRAGDAGGARALLSAQQGREVGKLAYGLGFGTEAYRLLPAEVRKDMKLQLELPRTGTLGFVTVLEVRAADTFWGRLMCACPWLRKDSQQAAR